jgi:hypothetical protein
MIGCAWNWRPLAWIGGQSLVTGIHRVRGQLSKEIKVHSIVLPNSDLCALIFLVQVNDIWRYIAWSIWLFADDCIIYRKVTNTKDIEKLQKDLDTLGEWAVDNEMKINHLKRKAIRFRGAGVKILQCYGLCYQKCLKGSSCKYYGIMLRSDKNCVDQLNYTV